MQVSNKNCKLYFSDKWDNLGTVKEFLNITLISSIIFKNSELVKILSSICLCSFELIITEPSKHNDAVFSIHFIIDFLFSINSEDVSKFILVRSKPKKLNNSMSKEIKGIL